MEKDGADMHPFYVQPVFLTPLNKKLYNILFIETLHWWVGLIFAKYFWFGNKINVLVLRYVKPQLQSSWLALANLNFT